MGKAIEYTYTLPPRLSRYVNDGRIDTINFESTTNSTDSELIHKICNVVYRILIIPIADP